MLIIKMILILPKYKYKYKYTQIGPSEINCCIGFFFVELTANARPMNQCLLSELFRSLVGTGRYKH